MLALILGGLCLGLASAQVWEAEFQRSAILDPDRLTVFWKDDGERITFELHARTKGWVGLGFSSNGGMGGADIVVAGLKDGQGYLHDRHAEGNSFPSLDAAQSYTLLSASENGTHTVVRFDRPLDTCDADDRPIGLDTVRLIWALHDEDAEDENSFPKHVGQRDRGSRSALLLDEPYRGPDSLPPNVQAFDLRAESVELPSDKDTMYWCTMHKLPVGRGKREMVRFGPLITPGNEPFVHHAVIYHCMQDMEDLVGQGGPCFDFDDVSVRNPMRACSSRFLAAWAVGGGDVMFPENMGFPLMEEGTSPYLMLEMHYDNPQLRPNIVDSSGMRLWLSPEERPVEVGNLILGLGVGVDDFMIPPGQEKLTYYSVCTAKCTKDFPDDGVKLLNIFPHAHLVGSGLRLRQIRDGVELPPIFSDGHYDFNYQEQRPLSPNPTILPGDVLVTECDFDTTSRTETTYSSFSSRDEMCLILANFYPKQPDSMLMCMGGPDPETFYELMGARKTPDKERARNGQMLVSGPLSPDENITFTEYGNRFFDQRDPDFGRRVEELRRAIQEAQYYTACGGRDDEDLNDEVAEEEVLRAKREGREGLKSGGRRKRIEKMAWKMGTTKGLVRPDVPYEAPSACPNANRPAKRFRPQQREGSGAAGLGGGLLCLIVAALLPK